MLMQLSTLPQPPVYLPFYPTMNQNSGYIPPVRAVNLAAKVGVPSFFLGATYTRVNMAQVN